MTVSIDGTTGVTTPAVILPGSTSGTITLVGPAIAGTTSITFPAISGTVLLQTISGSVTLTNPGGGTLTILPAVGSTTAQVLAFPAAAGGAGQVLTSDGAGGSSWASGSLSSTITIGTTTIASGTTGSILIDTANVLQQLTMGAGVSGALAAATNSVNGFPILGAGGVLQPAQGGTGVNSLGVGVGAALQNAINSANGLPILGAGGVLQPAQGGTGVNSLGAGVSSALQNATNTANGFGVLGAGGVLQTAQGGTGVNSLGAGVTAALQNAVGTANGIATLNASGVVSTLQGGTGNSTAAGTIAVGSPTQTGTLKIYNSGAGANPLSIQSAINTVPWTLTLPVSAGSSGQVLTTNGSGVSYWATAATVAGATSEVQYNNAGTLGANAGFTYDGSSVLTLGISGTSTGRVVLNNGTNANTVAIRSGITTVSYTMTLPTNVGTTGYVLTTDGTTGALTWAAPSAPSATAGNFDIGTPSTGTTPTTGNLNLYNAASPNAVTIQSGNNTSPWTLVLPIDPGTVGQVLQTDGSGTTSWVNGDITLGTTTVALGATSLTLDGLNSVTVAAAGFTPVNAGDLTSKQYVDALFSTINNNIGGVTCATTAPITLSGLQTIDGITLVGGERVLVKNGSIANGAKDDGVYDVDNAGVWTYSSDANTWAEYVGAIVFVMGGTTYTNTSWLQTVGVGGTLGTTPMNWAQINSPLNYSGGTGITITGNVIDNTGVVSIATGTTGLTFTVGAGGVTAITGELSIANGGTGKNNAQDAIDALLPSQGPNNGKFLTTDGTNASWAVPTAGSATAGNFDVGTGGTTQGTINLFNSTNSNAVTLTSGVNTAAWTMKLPTGPGTSGQALVTDGSGNTSWSTVGSGTVNSGNANEIAYYSVSGTAVSGNANATISSGSLTLGVANTAAGALILNGSTSGTVAINTAASAGIWALTLPTSAGTNGQVLITDGSGLTSWGVPAASSGAGGTFSIGTASSTTGTLSLYNASSAFGVTLKSGNNTATWNLTLPTGAGASGQVLQTDGAGVTSWATLVNSGNANELAYYSAAGTAVSGNANATISSGALTLGVANTAAGSILLNGSTSGTITVKTAAAAGAWSLTLPTSAGTSGQILTTDGNGVTAWTAAGSGTVNSGNAKELAYYSVTGTAVSGDANATISAGALTLGVAGTTAGSLLLSGSTSGTVTVGTSAAAGTWTLTLPADAGTLNQVLATDGTGITSWVSVPTAPKWVNAATVASPGDEIWVDSSAATRTITLPSSPTSGTIVTINRIGANNVIVARNGSTILGGANNFILDVDHNGGRFVYLNNTWQVQKTQLGS